MCHLALKSVMGRVQCQFGLTQNAGEANFPLSLCIISPTKNVPPSALSPDWEANQALYRWKRGRERVSEPNNFLVHLVY